ncbi:ThiF family adenylyltransferase [bacterium SCSIO 12741]|nr:ThiF family adenylyltransferase [bacterium SCSIO 12741]
MEKKSAYRYSRQIALPEIGDAGQKKLSEASVLIIGVGGLGCPAAQYLAGAGIGRIGLADFDQVEEHNLHRQVLFGHSDLGRNKASAAANRLRELNPTLIYEVYEQGVTAQSAEDIIQSYDVVIDGTDNYASRYLINDWCGYYQKPLVYGGVSGFEGQVSVFHQEPGFDYRSLFPEPPSGREANCAVTGVLGLVPGMVGMQQAHEVIKLILGYASTLSGKLWVWDSRTGQTQTWDLTRQIQDYSQKPSEHAEIVECDAQGAIEKHQQGWLLCDVREEEERIAFPFPSDLQVSWSQWDSEKTILNTKNHIVFVCQSGVRSRLALQAWTSDHPLKTGSSLKGGVQGLSPESNLLKEITV